MIKHCARSGCSNTFEVANTINAKRRKYCGRFCQTKSNPSVARNDELIEQVGLYLSLGFTAEQTYTDFVEGVMKPASFLKLLERRHEKQLASAYRRWLAPEREDAATGRYAVAAA